MLTEAAERREAFVLDYRLRRADGEYRWVLAAVGRGTTRAVSFSGFVGSVIDAHERKLAENALRESEAILAGQKEAFQAAMDGRPLAAGLEALVRTAVAHYGECARPRSTYSQRRSSGGAAPVTGMSDEYARQVDGFKIGPESLGVRAGRGRRTEPVIATDVEQDPSWEPWLWLAHTHGYRACWLFPVQTSGGPILGMFALYFAEPRAPTRDDLNVVGGFGACRGHRHLDNTARPRSAPAPSKHCRKRTAARTSSWPCSATSCGIRSRRYRWRPICCKHARSEAGAHRDGAAHDAKAGRSS